jgi:hypothetical protein
MSTQKNSGDTPNFRGRSHRFTAMPVKDVLRISMKDLGIKNRAVQEALGYPTPNVIAMMKTGSMRVPANKVLVVAEMLQIDPTFLLGKVIAENDPELWEVISALVGNQLVSANELALIRLVRKELDGHDVNLAEAPAFVDAALPVLKEILDRQNALAQAAKARIDE